MQPPSRCHYLDKNSVGADRRIVVAVVLVVGRHISAHVIGVRRRLLRLDATDYLAAPPVFGG